MNKETSLMDDAPPATEQLAQAARAVLKQEIKSLQLIPAAALKLLRLTNDEHAKANDLSRVIETEPALAARVLRIVNSAAFFMPKKISSIKQAVNILGFSVVRQTALAQLFYNDLIRPHASRKFEQLHFWQHCLFVATLSREIGLALRHADPDVLYTAGLLHDVGKIVLESYGHVTYSNFLEATEKSDSPMVRNEKAFFGLTHTEVGYIFCLEWDLPATITAVIAYHHQPPTPDSDYYAFRTDIAIVAFANYIAWMQGIGSGPAVCDPDLCEETLKLINFSKLNFEDLLERVDKEMASTREFYGTEFPSVAKLRASLVQATIRLGHKPDKRSPILHPTAVEKSPSKFISSLTVPHRSLNQDDIVPWTLEAIHNDFGFDRVVMLHVDPKRRGLAASHHWPLSMTEKQLRAFDIAMDAITGRLLFCVRNRKPVLIDKHGVEDEAILQRLRVEECIAIPVLRHNRFVGIVYADNVHSKKKLESAWIVEMMPIVNELGIALLNAKEYDMAKRQAQLDPLSQLHNKRMINEYLLALFQGEQRALTRIAIGFIDIDRFKLFNDVFGHQAGDDVIKIVADILRSMTRPGDFVGRYGGEEFLFVLSDTDERGAQGYAERIRSEVEKRGKMLSERFHNHVLTVSIGVTVNRGGATNYIDLIRKADMAMYQAKNQGRNQVVMQSDGSSV